MGRFLITEEEKKEILNLYKKFVIVENDQCLCPDGTYNVSCCQGSAANVVVGKTPKQKEDVLSQARLLVQKEEELKQEQVEKEKKDKIDKINLELKVINDQVMSKDKMTRYQKKITDDRIKILKNELNMLNDMPSSEGGDKSADEKVSAWIGVASGLLGLFTSILTLAKPSE